MDADDDGTPISTLVSMGFDETSARLALGAHGNNVQRAVGYLVGGGDGERGGEGGGGGRGGGDGGGVMGVDGSSRFDLGSAPSGGRCGDDGRGDGWIEGEGQVRGEDGWVTVGEGGASGNEGGASGGEGGAVGAVSSGGRYPRETLPGAEEGRYVRCGTSQYSFGVDGRSACTCIALAAADMFLLLSDSDECNAPASLSESGAGGGILTPEFLSSATRSGVAAYNAARATVSGKAEGWSSSWSSPSAAAVEHMSAEEVLSNTDLFPNLAVVAGGVRQGMLSSDPDNPLGLRATLEGCRSDPSASSDRWMAVLITKAPETVVCVLPPSSSSSSSSSEGGDGHFCALIDSHPRPQLEGAGEGSYASIHGDLTGLVGALDRIFPPTDLGPDVGDMMTMMYNTFDVYPLQKK